MTNSSNHAIVFGASGIIGWAIVDQLLHSYPHLGSFKKVTAVTNRPLNVAETYWPEPNSQSPELQLVSGIDLRYGDGAALAKSLTEAVEDIGTVTHIFYLGTFTTLLSQCCRVNSNDLSLPSH
jgi:nucleoside-diphosphate-sugar epimerase